MTGYTGSVLVYMQLMLILCVFYSFYSDFGWFEIRTQQSTARFYINPLQSCIFDSHWSERYHGSYILTFCEPTSDFAHHLTNSSDPLLKDFIKKVRFEKKIELKLLTVSVFLKNLTRPKVKSITFGHVIMYQSKNIAGAAFCASRFNDI